MGGLCAVDGSSVPRGELFCGGLKLGGGGKGWEKVGVGAKKKGRGE